MKKLHSLAFYALITPAITLGAGSVLAQQDSSGDADLGEQSMGHDVDPEKQDSPQHQGATKSKYNTAQSDENAGGQSGMQNRGYMASAPANGTYASDMIGAEIKNTGDEEVGPVNDLIIDENGQVVAVVVGVGGFLGMAKKDVAIGWDDVTVSGGSDELELRIDATEDDLRAAPEFKARD